MVKKLKKLLVCIIFIFFINPLWAINKKYNNFKNVSKNDIISVYQDGGKECSLSLYSRGLFYKQLALAEKDKILKDKHFNRALVCFFKAGNYNQSLDRIYNQISDCYYYQQKLELSINFARKSISKNKNFLKPYIRIYRIYLGRKDNKNAAQVLHDYLKVNTDSVRIHFELGRHYYERMKDYNSSQKEFLKVINISENAPILFYYKKKTYSYLGHVAYKQNHINESIYYFREAYHLDRNDVNALYFLANLHMMQYHLYDAEKYSKLFLAKNQTYKPVNSILGRVLFIRREPGAINYLGRIKNNKSVEGLLSKGLYCELLKQDKKAIEFLKLVLRYRPKTVSVHIGLARILERAKLNNEAFNFYFSAGILLYKRKQFHEAKFNFHEAIRLKPGVLDVHYYLGRVHEDLNNYSSAIYQYKKVNRLKYNKNVTLHIGYLYGAKKKYKKANDYFNIVIKKDPRNHRAYFLKGLISVWEKKYNNAQLNLEKAISIYDKSESYYFYLAVVMEKKKRVSKAIDYLKCAIKNDNKSARSYNYLGYIYAENNIQLNESLLLIKKALKIEPNNGAYMDSLGWVLFMKGNYTNALMKLLLAEKLLKRNNSSDPVVYDHLGDAYEKLGQYHKAIFYWKEAIKIEKNKKIENKIRDHQNRINMRNK